MQEDLLIDEDGVEAHGKLMQEIIDKSPKIRLVMKSMDKLYNNMEKYVEKHKTLHRGMGLEELQSIAKTGKVGMHKRDKYDKTLDFLPSSISHESAKSFADNHKEEGLTVTFDVSNIKDSYTCLLCVKSW